LSKIKPVSLFPATPPGMVAISGADVEPAGQSAAIRLAWRRSTYSGPTSNCVETAPVPNAILVRDSKVVASPVLELDNAAWQTFIGVVGG